LSRLDQVHRIPRRRIEDARGVFVKALTGMEENLPPQVGEVYIVTTLTGQVRGNHYHPVTSEWFTVVIGQLVTRYLDPQTGEAREITLDAHAAESLYMPAGIAHAFKNIGQETAVMIAYADHTYDPADTIAYTVIDETSR